MNFLEVVYHVQQFTKRWPEPLRLPQNAGLAGTDADRGFERLLRTSLESKLPLGSVAVQREMGFGDGRSGVIIPRHELDLILRVEEGLFVLEAKAWREPVDKDPVIVFLGKLIDFLAASEIEVEDLPLRCGFISLAGFTEAAQRLLSAFSIIPFTQQGDQISFHYLDMLLMQAMKESQQRGWSDLRARLESHRENLKPYLLYEGRPLNQIVNTEPDSIVVDLHYLRRASGWFTDSLNAHGQALEIRRVFRTHSEP